MYGQVALVHTLLTASVDKINIKPKPTTVSEHFLSHSNHSHTDMHLIPLEKIRSSRDSVRKARESHLIAELLARAKRAQSAAPWVRKFGKLSI